MSHPQSPNPSSDLMSISIPVTVFRFTMIYEPVVSTDPKFRAQTVHRGKTNMEYSTGFLQNMENKQSSWNKIMFFNNTYLYHWNASTLYFLFETHLQGSFLCKPSLHWGSFVLDVVHHQQDPLTFLSPMWSTEVISLDWDEPCMQHSLFSFCHYFEEVNQQHKYFHKALSVIYSDRTVIPLRIESDRDLKWILDNLYERVQILASQQSVAVFEDSGVRGMESHVELRKCFKSRFFQPPKPQSVILRGIHRNSQPLLTPMPSSWFQ